MLDISTFETWLWDAACQIRGPSTPGMTVYDPACGSGGLLIKCHQRLLETHGEGKDGHRKLPPNIAGLRLFGQEINSSTFAIARMLDLRYSLELTFPSSRAVSISSLGKAEGWGCP